MATTKKDQNTDEAKNPAAADNSGMKGAFNPMASTDDSASGGPQVGTSKDELSKTKYPERTTYVPDEQGRSGKNYGSTREARDLDPKKEQVDSGDQTEEQKNVSER